jgi:antitoxin CptB
MDETPKLRTPGAPGGGTENLDGRRRRLLFRANHRGTRENDILVGGFVSARIGDFTESEILSLEAIMELPDPLLGDWLTGRAPIPEEDEAPLLCVPLLRAMREARGA